MVTFSMPMVLLSKEGETDDGKIVFTHIKEGIALVAGSVLMGVILLGQIFRFFA